MREGRLRTLLPIVTEPLQICVFQLVDTQFARLSHCAAPCGKYVASAHKGARKTNEATLQRGPVVNSLLAKHLMAKRWVRQRCKPCQQPLTTSSRNDRFTTDQELSDSRLEATVAENLFTRHCFKKSADEPLERF